MEPSSSDFINNSLEILNDTIVLPYLRAGINRLLYPQKYIHKGIVQVDEDCIILDDDKRDETVLVFCELIFSHYAFLYLIDDILKNNEQRFISAILDAINRRCYNVRNKKYSTFHDVHKFLLRFHKTNRARILHCFQFSNNTIIELLELLDEDYIHFIKTDYFKDSKYLLNEDDDYFNNYILPERTKFSVLNYIKKDENHDDCYEWYSEDSHRRFLELIKRENYTPLFFAVLVYNYISKTTTRLDFVDFVFTDESCFELDTLSIRDASYDTEFLADGFDLDLQALVQNNLPFSDCKFTEWVDEWFENFDSFVKEDDFSKWIDYESDEYIENHNNNINIDIGNFLLTRGWEIPGHEQLINDEEFLLLKGFFKEYVGNELKRKAVRYSIIQDCIPDEERAVLNWWLSETHYYKIFNKLVEYYSAKYMLKDSVYVSDETVTKPGINEYSSIGGTTPNDKTKQIKTKNYDLLYIRVLDEKIPGPESDRVSRRRECLEKLYCILIERDYIDENTDKELFLYRFTGLGEPYSKDQTICWKGVNRLLGYIARCLLTYRNSGTEGLGKFGELFEDEDGNHPYLPSAKHITLEEYNKNPDKRSYQQFKEAIEILQKCGFINVENTSPRGRK